MVRAVLESFRRTWTIFFGRGAKKGGIEGWIHDKISVWSAVGHPTFKCVTVKPYPLPSTPIHYQAKMSGDGQSRENVQRSVKGVKSIVSH